MCVDRFIGGEATLPSFGDRLHFPGYYCSSPVAPKRFYLDRPVLGNHLAQTALLGPRMHARTRYYCGLQAHAVVGPLAADIHRIYVGERFCFWNIIPHFAEQRTKKREEGGRRKHSDDAEKRKTEKSVREYRGRRGKEEFR